MCVYVYVYVSVTKHDTKMATTSRRRRWVHFIVNSNYIVSDQQQQPNSKIWSQNLNYQLWILKRTIIINV
jgi:hypothetical protein